jgi:catechol 2,3-dioxygenase-like lactoylglutathione lyase family enzyme
VRGYHGGKPTLQNRAQLNFNILIQLSGFMWERHLAAYVKLTLPGDSTSLELIQFKNPPSTKIPNPGKANTQGLRHLAFRVADIEKAVSFLKTQGIEPFSSIQEYAPASKKLVYFKGPEGILLELAQYGAPEFKAP